MSGIFDSIYTVWNQMIYAILNMRIPQDIIDIVIMAYVFYKAIGFLRDTRAGQLVKGLMILFFIYLISDWFALASVRWLLARVVGSVLILVVIIFQPELRRLLEQVGRTKFARSRFGETEEDLSRCIDDVSKALASLQSTKTGALIVFERSTQLGEIINTGTIIDATSSVSMVNNIFFPKSPLHDGALIVRDGKLYAAGCILPLTQREDLSLQLGTRHRAAIGMTENSDAIVVVVSEETGTISIAVNGKITRDFNAVSAGAELRRQLLVDEEDTQNGVVAAIKSFNPFTKLVKSKEGENKNEKDS